MYSISYAITIWNEHKELDRLLHQLKSFVKENDEIVVQMDSRATDEVKEVLKNHNLVGHSFEYNDNTQSFKNNLNKLCTKDYILQIDGDELLSDKLLKEIDNILESNSDADVFIMPRINILVDESELEDYINNLSWVNNESDWRCYPDEQIRLFKNKTNIVWGGDRMHTHLVGFNTLKNLNKGYDLIHVKSFQKQKKQDDYYAIVC